MGLGLYLYGDVTQRKDALLEDARMFVRAKHGDVLLSSRIGENDDGHRALWLSLHPAEEEVELRTVGGARVLVSARTSGAGPGYHAWLCDLLVDLGAELGIRWQAHDPTGETGDETSYFHQRDRPKLEAEMRQWLSAVAQSLTSRESQDWTGIAISMPVNAPQYEVEGVVTPLGPREAAFWQKIAADDGASEPFFAWWEPGTGAGYLLGRALCRMWADVRWVAPRNEDEEEVHFEVLDLLLRAYALDPSRAYPFAEWAELARLNGKQLPKGAQAEGKPSIGYRRGHLTARPYRGVSLRIPGAFSEQVDKKGSWCAHGAGRTVWISHLQGKRKSPSAEGLVDQPEPVIDTVDENGERVHRVHGRRVLVSADELKMAIVSVLFSNADDERWALETYRSVKLE